MENSGMLRTERNASAANAAQAAISHSALGRREHAHAKTVRAINMKSAAWSQLIGGRFHSSISGRSQSTLPINQRSIVAPHGLQNSAPPAASVAIQSAARIFPRSAGWETSGVPRLQKVAIDVALAESSSNPNPASAPPCVLIQKTNRNGNAHAHGQAP